MKEQKTQTETVTDADKPAHEDVARMETGDAVERAIHRFVGAHVHNSPISANTEVYNYLMTKLPVLRQMIEEETGK